MSDDYEIVGWDEPDSLYGLGIYITGAGLVDGIRPARFVEEYRLRSRLAEAGRIIAAARTPESPPPCTGDTTMSEDEDTGYRLVLEIEVPEFWVDGSTQEAADEWNDGDILPIVLEEWMRSDVGLTFVSQPGEKNLNSDFEVHAMNGVIVGARIVPRPGGPVPETQP